MKQIIASVFLYPCRGYNYFSQKFATQWRRRFRPHKVYIFLISITRRVDLAMSVCPSVRLSVCPSVRPSVCPSVRMNVWDLGNYTSYNTGIRHADSWDSCAAQVCFSRVPRPLQRPQTAQNCVFYSFDDRIKIFTEMYWSRQYLSIDPKKICHAHSNAHNAYICLPPVGGAF